MAQVWFPFSGWNPEVQTVRFIGMWGVGSNVGFFSFTGFHAPAVLFPFYLGGQAMGNEAQTIKDRTFFSDQVFKDATLNIVLLFMHLSIFC